MPSKKTSTNIELFTFIAIVTRLHDFCVLPFDAMSLSHAKQNEFKVERKGEENGKRAKTTAVTVSAIEHQQRHKVCQNVSKIINFLNFLWTSLRALLFLFTSILLKIIINNFTSTHWISCNDLCPYCVYVVCA